MKSIKNGIAFLLALVLALSCVPGMMPEVSAAEGSSAANVAYGKSVAFGYGSELVSDDGNYSVAAVKNGLSVLTDGIKDSANWWNNNGNPYVAMKSSVIAGPYIFSVDLGSVCNTEQYSIYSYGRPDWGVYPADAVTFTGSVNGTDWISLGTVELTDAVKRTIPDPRYNNEQYADIYEFRLMADASVRYVRATFSANASGLVGMGEFEVYGLPPAENISQGAEVTYFGYDAETGSDANWGSSAVNSGLSVLTDGVSNSPNWWVNNGNPNIGLKDSVLSGPYVINLGLGASSLVTEISTYFYSRTAWGVDRPEAVTYSVSTDGINWKQVGTVNAEDSVGTTIDDSRNPDDQKPTIYRFTLATEGVDALYVKVSFDTNSVGLIGLQEIEVMGLKRTVTNLALGKMANTAYYEYQITGGGTGYEASGTTKSDGTRYTVSEVENASIPRLTDGTVINSSVVTYPSSWGSAAWNSSGTIMSKYMQIYRNDSRIITLDLGAVRNITGIRMHFAAREAAGFYMPTNVTYYLSADGENYYEVADVWNYDSIADTNDSSISGSDVPRHEWFAARNINFNARYVKIIFPVNVYILSDELQVYGSEILSANPTALTSCPKYDPLEDYVGHYAALEQSGGVKNEFMAYSGWYINSDGSEVYNTYKTVDEYMCALAYVDENGVPQDWMFDDMTVMGHYYTSSGTFNSYKAGYTSGKYYANQDDWYEWLCYAFGKDVNGNDLSYNGVSTINLEALEEAARIAKETLNDPDYKVGVKLVLFPAVEYQEDWGYIDGQHIDFTIDGAGSQAAALANRKAAYQWYVDTAVEMWENAGFEHLELTGFYYYEETIHESTDRIARAATQALTDIVHSHATPSTNEKPAFDSDQGGQLYIYQLPYYQSEGYWNWAEYGFDYALMQPNYSFYDMYTLTQLEECGNLCKFYGLGMQMEFGGTASTAYHEKFEDYLTYGDDFGYQNAVLSWYMSTWGCYSMAKDTNGTRYLYDMVYEFVKTQNANLIAGCAHTNHTIGGECVICLSEVEHSFEDGVCGCGAEELVPKVTAKNATLTLEDEVSINIYFIVENMSADTDNMGLLAWDEKPANPAYDNAEYRFGGVSLEGERYKVTTDPIAAKNMGDSRYYMTYVKQDDGSYVYSQLFTYSPKVYAMSRLEESADEELRKLCVALLNYGAEAQKYFASTNGYKYTTLMNADLTDEQKAYVEAYREDMVPAVVPADASKVGSFTATANSFTSKKATVTLGGALAVNFYLKPSVSTDGMTMYYWSVSDYAAASVLTADNATGTYEMELLSDGRYLASVENISAKNMADTVYVCGVYEVDGVTHSTGVIAYSIGMYCTNMASAASDVQALAKATAVYGYYAKAYFNK